MVCAMTKPQEFLENTLWTKEMKTIWKVSILLHFQLLPLEPLRYVAGLWSKTHQQLHLWIALKNVWGGPVKVQTSGCTTSCEDYF